MSVLEWSVICLLETYYLPKICIEKFIKWNYKYQGLYRVDVKM